MIKQQALMMKKAKPLSVAKKVFTLKVIIHIAALFPLVQYYYLAISGQLLGDPVEQLIHFTGIAAFNLLLLTLLVSPLVKYTKQSFLMQVRRLLGLYAFFYAVLHIINFWVLDLHFDGYLLLTEVVKRPYISLGMLAFLLLFALAVSSHDKLKRKMGKTWQKLHNFSYIIVLLVSVHYYWSVKSDVISPLIYCLLTCILLLLRYKKLKALILSLFVGKTS